MKGAGKSSTPVCGVCGKEVHLTKSGLPAGGMYLCDLHRPYPTNCASCPLVVICNDRVHLYKVWVLCELPTSDDFERMEMNQTPESVAYPFRSNPTLKHALFPMGGTTHGKQTTTPTKLVPGQTSLPDLGSGLVSGIEHHGSCLTNASSAITTISVTRPTASVRLSSLVRKNKM